MTIPNHAGALELTSEQLSQAQGEMLSRGPQPENQERDPEETKVI